MVKGRTLTATVIELAPGSATIVLPAVRRWLWCYFLVVSGSSASGRWLGTDKKSTIIEGVQSQRNIVFWEAALDLLVEGSTGQKGVC